MQITLNKVPFDLSPVDGALRAALLADPLIASGTSREVWGWDGTAGRWLVPVTAEQALPLPTGLIVHVPRTGGQEKAKGPTRKMAERFMSAVGATSFAQVMQALTRVTGLPQKKVPFEAYKALMAQGPFRIRMDIEFSVLEMANPGRNLSAYVFVPGLVSFAHVMDEVPEGAAAPGTIRPGFVIPPLNQAVHALRRMAVARRLTELQGLLGETQPRELAAGDPIRAEIGKLGAEWKVLQSQPGASRAA